MGNIDIKRPLLTVDIIIEIAAGGGIVLIERKNPPYGWALPGGFVDEGESLEAAAVREAREETLLDVKLTCQMQAYSEPERDPRFHTVSVVFVAHATGTPVGSDDAARAEVFTEDNLPEPVAFDHARIIKDYFRWKREGFNIFTR
jgi:8-oxo-dGTP diphosphatase